MCCENAVVLDLEEPLRRVLLDAQPFGNFRLNENYYCIRCEKIHKVKDAKLVRFKDGKFVYVYCAAFPCCDGSVIDWISEDAGREYAQRKKRA